MIKLKLLLKEESEFTPIKYASQLEEKIKEIFPKSFVSVYVQAGSTTSIYIKFAIGKDKTEWVNGYIENDPSDQRIWIRLGRINNNLPDKIKVESKTGIILIKPEQGSYLAYSRVKTGWRDKTGSPEAIMNYIVSYFKKFKEIWKDNVDNLTYDHQQLLKNKY